MARASPISPTHSTDRILGNSSAIAALRAQIRHMAPFDAVGHHYVPTVLLHGETGTGKGLVRGSSTTAVHAPRGLSST
jgi:transcriptional regulator with GAF, ATPase, and Fis domain